jgi:hypothetical protein
VDLLIENGPAVVPVEIKAGATTADDYLRVGSTAPSVAPTVLPTRTRPVDRSPS